MQTSRGPHSVLGTLRKDSAAAGD